MMYKKAQQELEQDKLKKDNIIEDLINNGMIDSNGNGNNVNEPKTLQPIRQPIASNNTSSVSVISHKNVPSVAIKNPPNIVNKNAPIKIPNNTVINTAPVNNKIRYKVDGNKISKK